MRLRFPMYLAATMALSTSVSAQSLDSCAYAYKDQLRNLSFTKFDYSTNHAVYDEVCTSSGEVNQTKFEAGLSILPDSLPIELTGEAGTSRQRTENFCKNYRSTRYSANHSSIAKSEVVVAALNSFNSCRNIEVRSGGVVATHSFTNPDAVVIKFTFPDTNRVLRIEGVKSTNLECRAAGIPHGSNSGVLGVTSTFEMRSDFSILCSRESMPTDGGGRSYAPGTVTVATNHAPYLVSLPQDRVYSNHLASEATTKIAALETSLKSTASDLSALTADHSKLLDRIKAMTVETHSVIVASAHPGGGGKWYPCGQDLEVVRRELCQGAVSSQVQWMSNSNGGTCGNERYAVVCVRY